MSATIVPIRVYVVVFAALMVLLVATVAVSYLSLGLFNGVIALSIAAMKTLLVLLFFMHVRYGSRLVWVFAGVGFFWLAILLVLTMGDVLTRGTVPPPGF